MNDRERSLELAARREVRGLQRLALGVDAGQGQQRLTIGLVEHELEPVFAAGRYRGQERAIAASGPDGAVEEDALGLEDRIVVHDARREREVEGDQRPAVAAAASGLARRAARAHGTQHRQRQSAGVARYREVEARLARDGLDNG